MPAISISLIRQVYDNASADELSSIQALNLAGLGIDVIENLEVFAEITELRLNNNRISNIENINFMYNLDYLDLSYNNIDSSEIVRSIKDRELPACLRTINLSGNPCANDENVLSILQDNYNELNIIIGIEDDENNDDNDEDDGNDEPEINEDDDNELQSDQLLDSDTVLKTLVERKCRLDKMKDFNIEDAVQKLNNECDNAINGRAETFNDKMTKNANIKERIQCRTDAYFQDMESAKDRVEKMLATSKTEKTEMSSFMKRLRESSLRLREETFAATTTTTTTK